MIVGWLSTEDCHQMRLSAGCEESSADDDQLVDIVCPEWSWSPEMSTSQCDFSENFANDQETNSRVKACAKNFLKCIVKF